MNAREIDDGEIRMESVCQRKLVIIDQGEEH